MDKILPLQKKDNLTKHERTALRNLTNNDQIIINKKADKGSPVVILNKEVKHLCDPKVYRKLNIDITDITKIVINRFLSNVKTDALANGQFL